MLGFLFVVSANKTLLGGGGGESILLPPLFQRLNETNLDTAQEGKDIRGEKHWRGERN